MKVPLAKRFVGKLAFQTHSIASRQRPLRTGEVVTAAEALLDLCGSPHGLLKRSRTLFADVLVSKASRNRAEAFT